MVQHIHADPLLALLLYWLNPNVFVGFSLYPRIRVRVEYKSDRVNLNITEVISPGNLVAMYWQPHFRIQELKDSSFSGKFIIIGLNSINNFIEHSAFPLCRETLVCNLIKVGLINSEPMHSPNVGCVRSCV